MEAMVLQSLVNIMVLHGSAEFRESMQFYVDSFSDTLADFKFSEIPEVMLSKSIIKNDLHKLRQELYFSATCKVTIIRLG